MKKLLVVLGLSAIAMAGKCSSSKEEKAADSATKAQEEFPVKEETQTPPAAEEVPSYEQQAPADATGTTGATTTTAPTDTTTTAPTGTDTTTAPAAGTTTPAPSGN